jgi:hypothetical protein
LADQPKIAMLFGGELRGVKKHSQLGRGQKLHPVKIHHHDLRDCQLRGENGGQLRRGLRIDLTGHGNDTGIPTVLDHQ